MSRSFIILFIVSLENPLLILNFFFNAFILWQKANFLIMRFITPWWHWSIFGPTKHIWRSCIWSKMFIENWGDTYLFWLKFILFESKIIFSCISLFFFLEVPFTCLAKWFGIKLQYFEKLSVDGNTLTLSFSKYFHLAYLFRFATRFRCHLNLTMSLGFFWLISIVFEAWSDHFLLPKVLIKIGFFILS